MRSTTNVILETGDLEVPEPQLSGSSGFADWNRPNWMFHFFYSWKLVPSTLRPLTSLVKFCITVPYYLYLHDSTLRKHVSKRLGTQRALRANVYHRRYAIGLHSGRSINGIPKSTQEKMSVIIYKPINLFRGYRVRQDN